LYLVDYRHIKLRSLRIHILVVFTAFNVVSFNQFSKLPLLVAHFVDHWERDHKVGLVDFLDMHYFGHDINDHDDRKDKELPFKSFSSNSIQVFTVPENELNVVIHRDFVSSVDKPIIAGDQFVPTQVMSSLFRPPRVSA
jgi:hypothetical protein